MASCSLRAPFLRRKLDARGNLSDRHAERLLEATLASFADVIRKSP